jgi:hypothetical protein
MGESNEFSGCEFLVAFQGRRSPLCDGRVVPEGYQVDELPGPYKGLYVPSASISSCLIAGWNWSGDLQAPQVLEPHSNPCPVQLLH